MKTDSKIGTSKTADPAKPRKPRTPHVASPLEQAVLAKYVAPKLNPKKIARKVSRILAELPPENAREVLTQIDEALSSLGA